jgi:hypothetical protein
MGGQTDHEHLARPKEPSAAEIAWARHLLRRKRNLMMAAPGVRMTPLFAAIEDPPSGNLRFLWRSFVATRHSRYIDSFATDPATLGRAPVDLSLLDADSPNVSLRLEALACRVPEAKVAAALAALLSIRIMKGEDPKPNAPGELYEATITRATIPVPLLLPDGAHVGETHAGVGLEVLAGFSAK